MTRDVFCPAWVEKVWVTALSPLRVVIPLPAAPEPKQTPEDVWKQPEERAIPFANVLVAVELELIPPPTWRRPAILTLLLKVEDAEAKRFVNDEKLVEEIPFAVKPPANVEDAEEEMFKFPVELIFPPVIVSPAELASPPVESPPTNVEVAVEVAFTVPKPGEVEALITPLLKEIRYCPERLEVETFWLNVFQSVESKNPFVAVLEVEIANTPLFESYERGANAERDVDDTLLLKIVLSAV